MGFPLIAQRSQWRAKAYRKLPSLFLMVPSLTLYDLPFIIIITRKLCCRKYDRAMRAI